MKRKKTKYLIIATALAVILIFKSIEIAFIQKVFFVTFHKSGIVGDYFNSAKPSGEFETYVDGKLTRKANFKNGLIDGEVVYYYPDGVVKQRYFAKNNKKEGIEYSFYEDGKIKIKESFKEGKREGFKITYYRNGQIDQRILHKNDKAEGTEYAYYEDGKLKYTRNWLKGKQYGDAFYYFKDRKVELYNAYDILGDKFFLRRYDSSGKVTKDLGYLFSSNTYTKIIDSPIVLETGKRYKSVKDFYITVVHPPKLTPRIGIYINNKLHDDFIVIDENTVMIKDAFNRNGKYHISIVVIFAEKGIITDRNTGKLDIIKE